MTTAVDTKTAEGKAPPDRASAAPRAAVTPKIALLGNPNTGKTTLFNRLCGLRARTANFPGITVEARVGQLQLPIHSHESATKCDLVDLPGLYQLSLHLPESELCRKVVNGEIESIGNVAAALIVVDATNLARNLRLVADVRESGRPIVVALNMIDIAQKRGLTIDAEKLAGFLGAPVIPICAKTGRGVENVRHALTQMVRRFAESNDKESISNVRSPELDIPLVADGAALTKWADSVVLQSVGGDQAVGAAGDTITDRLDAAFTHPVIGIFVFGMVMATLFMTIFWVATFPMDFIDWFFGEVAAWVGSIMPEGALRDLLSDGIIGGVGSVIVFIPQICLLFFLISLLEDTGYLARAAFVMDRLLCRFGLPGQAFVPMLSGHACAIPGIMSTKLIPDPKDRLATILVLPFMSCSARVPVYVLLTSILFVDRPALAGLAFFGCYLLGAFMAMGSALVARRTILPGRSRPMVLELPTYKMPSLRTALFQTVDRATVFLKNAGTTILAICIVLWWMSAYPKVDPPQHAIELREQAAEIVQSDATHAAQLINRAEQLEAQNEQANSFIGRLGRVAAPVFQPIGCDWRLTIGVLSSFAAREVFASTMGVLISGSEDIDVEDEGVVHRIRTAERDDGSPLFTTATSASLLVFYVLAMQCLPTLVVTKRETGSWKWAGVQLAYMTVVAWVFAFVTYQGLLLFGIS